MWLHPWSSTVVLCLATVQCDKHDEFYQQWRSSPKRDIPYLLRAVEMLFSAVLVEDLWSSTAQVFQINYPRSFSGSVLWLYMCVATGCC